MKNKISIFYVWLISYIVILLLPVLAGSLLYMLSEQLVGEESIRSNSMLVKNIQQNSDAAIKEVNRLITQIAVDYKIDAMLSHKGDMTNKEWFALSETRGDLRVYNSGSNYIEECYVYLANSDIIFSVSNSMSFDDAAKYVFGKKTEDIQPFKSSLLASAGLKTMKINEKFNHDEGGSRYIEKIAFVQTIPVNTKNATGAIIMIVDKSNLVPKNMIDKLYNNSSLFILDGNNNIVVSNTNEGIDINLLQNKEDVSNVNVNGKPAYLVKTKSEISGWKHATIIPVDNFLHKLYGIRNFAIISLLLYLLIGGVFIKFFLKYNYSPINDLLDSIGHKGKYVYQKSENEFLYIKEIMSREFKEKEQISDTLNSHKKVLRTNFLQKLLKGDVQTGYNTNNAFASFDIKLISDYYLVVLIYVDDPVELFADDEDLTERERHDLTLYILNNVLSELLSVDNYAFTLEYEGMLACIVNIRQENLSEVKTQVEKTINETQAFIAENFNYHFTSAISNFYQTIGGISEAYEEAMSAMEYRIMNDESSIIFYDNIKTTQKGGYYYPLEKERQLINYICSGEESVAKELLEEIFAINFTDNFMTIQLVKCLMFDISSTMIKTVQSVFGNSEGEFINDLSTVDRLMKCDSINDMRSTMNDILSQVCAHVLLKGEAQIKNKVIQFIEENYENINLSVSEIADYMKLHPTYVSAAFKEQTSEGLLKYIMKIRIEKSKKMLGDNAKTLEYISNAVGYANVRTFARVFKNIEGISPAKYRESNIENQK